MSWRLRTRWEPPRGCSTTGPHSHGSGRRPGSWLARVHTTPHQQALRLTAWRGAGAHTHHVLVATTTTPGSRLTSVVAHAHEMGTPKGLFRRGSGAERGARRRPPQRDRLGVWSMCSTLKSRCATADVPCLRLAAARVERAGAVASTAAASATTAAANGGSSSAEDGM